MEMRHLAGFMAVAEELSFRRAAARLHVSQPAVSRLIAQLEAELGVDLVDRSTHHVGLTPAGRALLDEARAVLERAEEAARVARQAGEHSPSTLRVAHTDCSEELVSTVLRLFRRELPSVRLEVRQEAQGAQARLLRRRELDVVMRRAPVEDAALESEVVAHEALMLAVPAGHPLAGARRVGLADLAPWPFVFLPGSPTHECTLKVCEEAGFAPDCAEQASTLASLVVLVSAGVGVAMVPASMAGRLKEGQVVYQPLKGTTAALSVVVAWRRADLSVPVQSFLDAARTLRVSRSGRVRSASDRLHALPGNVS